MLLDAETDGRVLLDADIREPLFNYLELYYGKVRFIEEKVTGRANADFGAGFYLTPDKDFAGNWAREKTAGEVVVNEYDLDTEGLKVKYLGRDEEWFRYIFHNRRGEPDALAGYDVVTGPIATDTLFETYGIVTSGLITDDQALELLAIGPEFTQTVMKTETAASHLKWTDSYTLSSSDLAKARADYKVLSEAFDAEFSAKLDAMST